MLNVNQATKVVRHNLRNPNLKLESWSQEQEEQDDNDMSVYRIQGYATDPIAYEYEGAPFRFDIRLNLANER